MFLFSLSSYLDNVGFVIIASRYIAITRALPVIERRHVILFCGAWVQASSRFLLLSVVVCVYSFHSYGMRIVVCLVAATVLKIGFNLDQKVCITPTMSQLLLYLLRTLRQRCGSDMLDGYQKNARDSKALRCSTGPAWNSTDGFTLRYLRS